MISGLSFNPVFPATAILVITLGLFAFFIWLEALRKQKFRAIRIIATSVMLISLLGILLKPSLSTEPQHAPSVLLTPGYVKSTVDSLVSTAAPTRLFLIKGADPYSKAEAIDINEVGSIPNLKIIVGNGLPADALDLLDGGTFTLIPGTNPEGIVDIKLHRPVRAHQTSQIHGMVNTTRNAKVILNGPAGDEDSTEIKAGLSKFTLRFTAKQTGLLSYALTVQQEHGSTLTENIPIEVKPEQKLKILFVQKFPTAETRYLKNYLASQGHQLTLRYQVSKSNFNYEYSNTAASPIGRLTPGLLASFDLLFLDQYVLDEMGSEKTTITSAVNDGLGVILFADRMTGKNNTLSDLLKIPASRWPDDTVHLVLDTQRHHVLPAAPVAVSPESNVQPVIQNHDRILEGYIFHGSGKIGFQLLRETYRMRLEGSGDDYAFVWRELIERTARLKKEKFKISIRESFPYQTRESISVDIVSDGSQPNLCADRSYVPVAEDVLLDDVWHARLWNVASGWHKLWIKGDSTQLNYFVSDSSEFKALREARQVMQTQMLADSPSLKDVADYKTPQPVNTLYFYLLFLAAAGLLWLVPKF